MDKRIFQAFGGGLASTAAVVVSAALISHFTGFDPFSFAVWFVVPVGAIFCGALSGYGFYWVAHRVHLQPGIWMVPLLLGLGAFAFVASHYLDYQMLTLEDGTRAADLVSFVRYMEVKLGSMTIRAGRGMTGSAELGTAGYWLAVLDFFAFVAASSWGYFKLRDSLACLRCNRYLRTRGTRARYFPTLDAGAEYYDRLFEKDASSPEFIRQASLGAEKGPANFNAAIITTTLQDCDGCHHQLWTDRVSMFDGKEWKEKTELARSQPLRPEDNVSRFVRPGAFAINLD